MKKLIIAILILAVCCTVLVACVDPNQIEADILTLKARDGKKIDVTVMVKYAFTINEFEKKVEKLFPNINIIQVGNYTGDLGIAEYEARMRNDDLTDIVMTWPLDVGVEYWDERLLDLSTLPITGNYTRKSLNTVSSGQDGKLYYLPGPSQVRGIVYNKTMFAKNGWQMPTSLQGFIDLCKQIESEKPAVRALQLGLQNAEVLDTAFVGYGLSDCFATPESGSALSSYDEGVGSFGDHFTPALDTFQRLITEGILRKSDLEIDYSKREQMLFNGDCAMVEDSVLLARMGNYYPNLAASDDEFGLMPFFNDGENNDWARLYPVCYIGLNKHLEDAGNEDKYAAVMALMDYISSPAGQVALAADTGAMFSNLKGVPAPEDKEISDLQTALNAGRYGVFPTLKNAQDALRKGLTGMVKGEYNAQTVIEMVDKQNSLPPTETPFTVYGAATDHFTMIETGSFVADAMREASGANFALFMDNGKDGFYNGKGLGGRIYKGNFTSVDLKRIMPDLKFGDTDEVEVASMTGANLKHTLEYSIPVNGETGWFYYISGLKIQFAPEKAQGSRIVSITDTNGQPIDNSKTYTVAVMTKTVDPAQCVASRTTGKFVHKLLQQKIAAAQTISPARDGRFRLVF